MKGNLHSNNRKVTSKNNDTTSTRVDDSIINKSSGDNRKIPRISAINGISSAENLTETQKKTIDETLNAEVVQWILDAIALIRTERQRPTIDRIIGKVRYSHKIDRSAVVYQLELAVREGQVLKIHHKGVFSYNDPTHIKKMRFRYLQISSSTDLSKVLTRSVREMGEENGSTLKNIETYVQHSYELKETDDAEFSAVVQASMEKALTKSYLTKTEDHTYKLGPKALASFRKCVSTGGSCSAKKKSCKISSPADLKNDVYDLDAEVAELGSDDLLDTSDSSENLPKVCALCQGTAERNREGLSENLLTCLSCGNSGHPSCLNYTPELSARLLAAEFWNCADCRHCDKCKEKNRDLPVRCDGCDKAFHRTCVDNPPKKSTDTWLCNECGTSESTKHNKKLVKNAAANVIRRYQKAQIQKKKKMRKTRSSTSESEDDDSIEAKHKSQGLVDSLTRYFTPTNKRRSRVSQTSFETIANLRILTAPDHQQQPVAADATLESTSSLSEAVGVDFNNQSESTGSGGNSNQSEIENPKNIACAAITVKAMDPSPHVDMPSTSKAADDCGATSGDDEDEKLLVVKQRREGNNARRRSELCLRENNHQTDKNIVGQSNLFDSFARLYPTTTTKTSDKSNVMSSAIEKNPAPNSESHKKSTRSRLLSNSLTIDTSQGSTTDITITEIMSRVLSGYQQQVPSSSSASKTGSSASDGTKQGNHKNTGKSSRKREVDNSLPEKSSSLHNKRQISIGNADGKEPDSSNKASSPAAKRLKIWKQKQTKITDFDYDEQPPITEDDRNLFKEAQQTVLKNMDAPLSDAAVVCPAVIQFGKYEIRTWCSSPYPQEYARLSKLFICEFCLKYIKSGDMLRRHVTKCTLRHPPGNEIYRKGDLSIFEVDGAVAKIYCQNLCLLAKLFLDHKTLYYDVEPFLFNVLTKNDSSGCHFVGYFSKEKYSVQKYNVSCIVTLPQYQKQGYGGFLIDFSYLLSRKENQAGTPEKPLSELGQISYYSYWLTCVLEYLHGCKNSRKITVKSICRATGMTPRDVIDVLGKLNFLQFKNGRHTLRIDWSLVNAVYDKAKNDTKRIQLDEECLRWHPVINSPMRALNASSFPSPEKEEKASDESTLNASVSPKNVRLPKKVQLNIKENKDSEMLRNKPEKETDKRKNGPKMKEQQTIKKSTSFQSYDNKKAKKKINPAIRSEMQRKRRQSVSSSRSRSRSHTPTLAHAQQQQLRRAPKKRRRLYSVKKRKRCSSTGRFKSESSEMSGDEKQSNCKTEAGKTYEHVSTPSSESDNSTLRSHARRKRSRSSNFQRRRNRLVNKSSSQQQRQQSEKDGGRSRNASGGRDNNDLSSSSYNKGHQHQQNNVVSDNVDSLEKNERSSTIVEESARKSPVRSNNNSPIHSTPSKCAAAVDQSPYAAEALLQPEDTDNDSCTEDMTLLDEPPLMGHNNNNNANDNANNPAASSRISEEADAADTASFEPPDFVDDDGPSAVLPLANELEIVDNSNVTTTATTTTTVNACSISALCRAESRSSSTAGGGVDLPPKLSLEAADETNADTDYDTERGPTPKNTDIPPALSPMIGVEEEAIPEPCISDEQNIIGSPEVEKSSEFVAPIPETKDKAVKKKKDEEEDDNGMVNLGGDESDSDEPGTESVPKPEYLVISNSSTGNVGRPVQMQQQHQSQPERTNKPEKRSVVDAVESVIAQASVKPVPIVEPTMIIPVTAPTVAPPHDMLQQQQQQQQRSSCPIFPASVSVAAAAPAQPTAELLLQQQQPLLQQHSFSNAAASLVIRPESVSPLRPPTRAAKQTHQQNPTILSQPIPAHQQIPPQQVQPQQPQIPPPQTQPRDYSIHRQSSVGAYPGSNQSSSASPSTALNRSYESMVPHEPIALPQPLPLPSCMESPRTGSSSHHRRSVESSNTHPILNLSAPAPIHMISQSSSQQPQTYQNAFLSGPASSASSSSYIPQQQSHQPHPYFNHTDFMMPPLPSSVISGGGVAGSACQRAGASSSSSSTALQSQPIANLASQVRSLQQQQSSTQQRSSQKLSHMAQQQLSSDCYYTPTPTSSRNGPAQQPSAAATDKRQHQQQYSGGSSRSSANNHSSSSSSQQQQQLTVGSGSSSSSYRNIASPASLNHASMFSGSAQYAAFSSAFPSSPAHQYQVPPSAAAAAQYYNHQAYKFGAPDIVGSSALNGNLYMNSAAAAAAYMPQSYYNFAANPAAAQFLANSAQTQMPVGVMGFPGAATGASGFHSTQDATSFAAAAASRSAAAAAGSSATMYSSYYGNYFPTTQMMQSMIRK